MGILRKADVLTHGLMRAEGICPRRMISTRIWRGPSRSPMSSERLGIIAKMDVVEADGESATPIDFKKGKRPHVPAGAYEPERVQVCAQAMILEDNGYQVEQGALWYAGSRERVPVVLDNELRARTLEAISGLRSASTSAHRPPPLENSPKCPRCSLAGICLPDETNLFRKGYPPRQLNPSDNPALPLYVQTPGARLRKSGEQLIVEVEEEKVAVPMIDVSQVALFGPVSVTTPALHALMRAEVPVSWFSTGGWFLGHTVGTGNGNVAVREAQYRFAFDEGRRLAFSRDLVAAKVRNSRTLLRRNWRADRDAGDKVATLERLKRIAEHAPYAESAQQLLGIEGEAAAIYFAHFENMLATTAEEGVATFSFSTRNRRPPADPVKRHAVAGLCFADTDLRQRNFSNGAGSIHGNVPSPTPRAPSPGPGLDGTVPFPGRRFLCDPSRQQRRGQAG